MEQPYERRINDNLHQLVAESRTSKLLIRARGGRVLVVDPDVVEWVEADGNYLRVHMAGETHVLRETMNAFEGRTAGFPFTRIHRSAMININRIDHFQPWYTGEYIVQMKSGKELTVSRTYKERFFEAVRKL
jgi:two-component system, LytTR family, response regulator